MKGYYFEGFSRRNMTQLNIRVSQNTATAFRQFCYEQNLTQNEALAILLTQITKSPRAESALWDKILFYKNEFESLNQKHTAFLTQQKTKEESDWKKVRDWAKVMQEMLDYILDRKIGRKWPAIKPGYFKRDHKWVHFDRYHYPKDAGCVVVQLDDLIYSRNRSPALFILAHRVNKSGETEYLKFRYYPRNRFVGVSVNASGFACRGSEWLIGCVPAPDGAMNVFAFLPIAGLMPTDSLLDEIENVNAGSDLDRKIRDAEKRRNNT